MHAGVCQDALQPRLVEGKDEVLALSIEVMDRNRQIGHFHESFRQHRRSNGRRSGGGKVARTPSLSRGC